MADTKYSILSIFSEYFTPLNFMYASDVKLFSFHGSKYDLTLVIPRLSVIDDALLFANTI